MTSEFSQSTQSQAFWGAQKPSRTLPEAVEAFNASLVMKNNTEDEDPGIHEILEALRAGNEDAIMKRLKMGKNIKKPQLIAGLGFLHDMKYEAAKDSFKGILVPELMTRIVNKYNLLTPEQCAHCDNIYDCTNNDYGAHCFCCDKSMCPDCCPILDQNKAVGLILFHICLKGSKEKLGAVGPEPQKTLVNDDKAEDDLEDDAEQKEEELQSNEEMDSNYTLVKNKSQLRIE